MSGRVRGHGLTDGESAIMDLWDSGERDFASIGTETGYGERYVQEVVGRYVVFDLHRDPFSRMSSAGSASLLAALHKFHPETIHGVHP